MKRLVVWLAACALLAPAVAWAHATLKSASPGFEQELQTAPKAVKLYFDQYVKFPAVTVYSSAGKTFVLKASSDGLRVDAPLGVKLPRGAYTVRWHVL